MFKVRSLSLLFFVMFILGGCAFDVIHVEQTPAHLSASDSCNDSFTLAKDIQIELGGGYSRILKQGTKWNCIGKISQGAVYSTKDQILTVEASNVFEANIVVLHDDIVGFYLPVEKTFSPLQTKAKIIRQKAI